MKALVGIFGDSCGCTVKLYTDGSLVGTGHTVEEGDELARRHVSATLQRLMKIAIQARGELQAAGYGPVPGVFVHNRGCSCFICKNSTPGV